MNNNLNSIESQGVTQQDVIVWRNLSQKQREQITQVDQSFRMDALKMFAKQGLSPEEANKKVWKAFAVYFEYPLEQNLINELISLGYSPEDYPLPYELHLRVDSFLKKIMTSAKIQAYFKDQINQYPTFNAFIRAWIERKEV